MELTVQCTSESGSLEEYSVPAPAVRRSTLLRDALSAIGLEAFAAPFPMPFRLQDVVDWALFDALHNPSLPRLVRVLQVATFLQDMHCATAVGLVLARACLSLCAPTYDLTAHPDTVKLAIVSPPPDTAKQIRDLEPELQSLALPDWRMIASWLPPTALHRLPPPCGALALESIIQHNALTLHGPSLAHTDADTAPSELCQSMGSLAHMTFHGITLSAQFLRGLSALTALESLQLRSCLLSENCSRALAHALPHLQRLRRLSMVGEGRPVRCGMQAILQGTDACTSLQHLELRQLDAGVINPHRRLLPTPRTLRSLHICAVSHWDSSCSRLLLDVLNDASCLTQLSLAHFQCTEQALILRALRRLELTAVGKFPSCCIHLAPAQSNPWYHSHLPNLSELILRGYPASGSGYLDFRAWRRFLGSLANWPLLHTLLCYDWDNGSMGVQDLEVNHAMQLVGGASLTELRLPPAVTACACEALSQLQKLRVLHVKAWPPSLGPADALANSLCELPHFQRLHMAGFYTLHGQLDPVTAAMVDFPKLHELTLEPSAWTQATGWHANKVTALRQLSLKCVPGSLLVLAKVLAEAANLPRLTVLRLSDCNSALDVYTYAVLSGLPRMDNLLELHFNDCRLGCQALTLLSQAVGGMHRLRKLVLIVSDVCIDMTAWGALVLELASLPDFEELVANKEVVLRGARSVEVERALLRIPQVVLF